MALTPLQPVVFFGFHKRMSVTGWICFIMCLTNVFVLVWLLMVIISVKYSFAQMKLLELLKVVEHPQKLRQT